MNSDRKALSHGLGSLILVMILIVAFSERILYENLSQDRTARLGNLYEQSQPCRSPHN